mmetsp:Transcript_142103/g.273023  ORF Transcript_142103/g.273023 Transcript_142103/m.273023 type:complete len:235 (-) Transcript_142103:1118-1822(-)
MDLQQQAHHSLLLLNPLPRSLSSGLPYTPLRRPCHPSSQKDHHNPLLPLPPPPGLRVPHSLSSVSPCTLPLRPCHPSSRTDHRSLQPPLPLPPGLQPLSLPLPLHYHLLLSLSSKLPCTPPLHPCRPSSQMDRRSLQLLPPPPRFPASPPLPLPPHLLLPATARCSLCLRSPPHLQKFAAPCHHCHAPRLAAPASKPPPSCQKARRHMHKRMQVHALPTAEPYYHCFPSGQPES